MLILDPAEELVLEGPFDRAVCKKIMVYNPSKQTRVAFKLKTTTPRLFFVRPSVGLVKPEENIAIDIFVHPILNDLHTHRHKFMMQAADASEPVGDLHEFWRKIDPGAIWDMKIRVKMIENPNPPQDKDASLANILQKVNGLEEERQQLLQKVESVTKQKEDEKNVMAMKLQEESKSGVSRLICIVLIVIAAIVGGFVAKKFM